MLQKYTNTLPIPLNEDTFRLLMSFLDLAGKIRITSTCKALYEFNPMDEYFKIYTLPCGTQSLHLAKVFALINVIFSKNANQLLRDVISEVLGDTIWNNKASGILCLKGDESLPEEQRKGQLPVELNTQYCKILWLFKLTYSSSILELFEKCKSLKFFICQNTTLENIPYECQLRAAGLELNSPFLVYLHLEYCIVDYLDNLLLSCNALKKAQLIYCHFKEFKIKEKIYFCSKLTFPASLEELVLKHEASTFTIHVLSAGTQVK
jgi:hypothetical protein